MMDLTERAICEVAQRNATISTPDGRKKAEQYMIGQFEYLRMCGYRIPDTNYKIMAKVWVESLRDYIVTYGFPVITESVKTFVKTDTNQYRQMPNPAQIIEVAKSIGKNPIAEQKRRELDAVAERMRAEVDEKARAELDDEKRKRFAERFPNLAAVIEGCTYGGLH